MTAPSGAAIAAERNSDRRQRAMLAAEEWVRTRIWRMEDDQIAALAQLYLEAYQEMAGGMAGMAARYGDAETWSASDANFRARTEAVLGGIYAEIARLTDAIQADVMDTAVRGWQGGAFGRAWLLDVGLRGVGTSALPFLPVEAIRAQLLAPYIGSTFLDRFIDARSEFEQLIRKALVESQIRGESIGQAQRRLAEALGVGRAANGKIGYAARLEMIARTEILRGSNLGAMTVYEANRDVLSGWSWLATKDEKTCPICGLLDGKAFEFGGVQSPPPAHPRCRCTEVPNLINSALEAAIVGPRETYVQWAARRGVTIRDDGGVLRFSTN